MSGAGATGLGVSGEAVVLGAEVTAGHDGEAELTLTVRFENGVVAPVVLDSEAGFEARAACGASSAAELAGQPWRRVIAGLAR